MRQIAETAVEPVARTGFVGKPAVDGQYHLARLGGVVQCLGLVRKPEQLFLAVALADVGAEFNKGLPDINPQDGLLTVVDISPGLGVVDVLQIVREHQRTLVVDANSRIEVIGQREPLAPRHEGREHILGPGVHHQEQLREQVIKKHGILFKMLCKLRFELGQTVSGGIRSVQYSVKGAVYRQLVSRGGGLVGAFQPRSRTHPQPD